MVECMVPKGVGTASPPANALLARHGVAGDAIADGSQLRAAIDRLLAEFLFRTVRDRLQLGPPRERENHPRPQNENDDCK